MIPPGTLAWDNHGCMPLRPGDTGFLPQLERYRTAGFDMLSLNVGIDGLPGHQTLQMLAHFRSWIAANPNDYVLASTVHDILRAKDTGKLAVAFDIEGANALNGQLTMIQLYYDLGVRWMLLAYNRNNRAAGGCHDTDSGLTEFGSEVIAEMARVGAW